MLPFSVLVCSLAKERLTAVLSYHALNGLGKRSSILLFATYLRDETKLLLIFSGTSLQMLLQTSGINQRRNPPGWHTRNLFPGLSGFALCLL